MSLKRTANAALLGAALLFGSGPLASQAQAGYVVTLNEVGSDVVAKGEGAIDLAGLTRDIVNGSECEFHMAGAWHNHHRADNSHQRRCLHRVHRPSELRQR